MRKIISKEKDQKLKRGLMRFTQKHIENYSVVCDISANETIAIDNQKQQTSKKAHWLPSKIFSKQTTNLFSDLREADPVVYELLLLSTSLQSAREQLFAYLDKKEAEYFDLLSPENLVEINITERCNAKECIRVFRNIIHTENERRTKFSALQALRNAIQNVPTIRNSSDHAFFCEIISLLHGINGNGLSFLAQEDDDVKNPSIIDQNGLLNQYAAMMNHSFRRFVNGIDSAMFLRQNSVKARILDYYNATELEWENYHWQLGHIFSTKVAIASVVNLSSDETAGLDTAEQEKISVQITPYYLSLFNPDGCDESDRAIRAQVLPTASYCAAVALNRLCGTDMDYMGENFTSPVEGVTRRYPEIAILKVFDSCPQICVYCQRNWEICDLDHGFFNETKMLNAIKWIQDHEEITEVLVTGGDPLTLDNSKLEKILHQLAAFEHIERIRIGTRTLVTMPCRINNGFLRLLRTYHKPGKREIVIMTHIEHATELTNAVIKAVTKIRLCGVSIYNQQVFTYYNSKKFETAFLRKNLRLCGIDPYYTFNTKGKDETADFRVPIARLLQERKEEARLQPGVVRTDEPVFNIPRLGKSHLRSWQDHEPIMILADGRRVYRFLPWESRLTLTEDYLYTDVSIYDYLKRLFMDGEDVDQYRTIWYYF